MKRMSTLIRFHHHQDYQKYRSLEGKRSNILQGLYTIYFHNLQSKILTKACATGEEWLIEILIVDRDCLNKSRRHHFFSTHASAVNRRCYQASASSYYAKSIAQLSATVFWPAYENILPASSFYLTFNFFSYPLSLLLKYIFSF